MKYVDEYRDTEKVKKLADLINSRLKKPAYKIMEVCGTHTNSIHRFGLKTLLSDKIDLISGPGCPVCVTSDGYLCCALDLAKNKNVIIATYPDMLRVPAKNGSLEIARSLGADIRSVSSALDALDLARADSGKEIVFLAVGFETTAPGTAVALKIAKKEKIKNFSVYSAHKTIPAALMALASDRDLRLDGFLLPGHVSAVIGLKGYRAAARKIKLPSVIAGFEPLDIMFAIYKIIQAANMNKPILENAYSRIVRDNGNPRAIKILKEVFIQKDSIWRGLGMIKKSGLEIKPAFRYFDARFRFGIKEDLGSDMPYRGCECASVLKGNITPHGCRYFGKGCDPEKPKGPCMVSREGTCRAYFEYMKS